MNYNHIFRVYTPSYHNFMGFYQVPDYIISHIIHNFITITAWFIAWM